MCEPWKVNAYNNRAKLRETGFLAGYLFHPLSIMTTKKVGLLCCALSTTCQPSDEGGQDDGGTQLGTWLGGMTQNALGCVS
jgi:hypothetical protein